MSQQERWGTRIGLVLAMAGNAVGLGNFLRFPAQAIQNGGGAFIIPYLVALVIMGLPLMWVEWTLGRYGGQRGEHAAPGILHALGKNRFWSYFGIIGLLSCLVVSSYYLYIESWCINYSIFSAMDGFKLIEAKEYFPHMLGSRPNSIFSVNFGGLIIFGFCIAINVYFLSRGLAKGIELIAKIGMPILILFAAVLAIRGLLIQETDPGAQANAIDGLSYLWTPQYDSLLNPSVWLAAAGQVFFTLSIGMGSILCYSSYLRNRDDVALTGATAAWTNEFCEIVLGGTLLIPIAVAYLGIAGATSATGSGLGMAFVTLPTLFGNWGALAPAAGFLWFGLLFFAAITSSLALGQPVLAFLQSHFNMSRQKSALSFAGILAFLAIPVAIFPLDTFFSEFDYWAGTFALVVFAFGEVILFSFVFGVNRGWTELHRGAELRVPIVFYYILKYVTPVFLGVILIGYIFQPEGEVDGKARNWQPYLSAPFTGKSPPAWQWSGSGMIGKLLNYDVPEPSRNATLAEREYHEDVKLLRTLSRVVMLAVVAFFAILLTVAWSNRRRIGEFDDDD